MSISKVYMCAIRQILLSFGLKSDLTHCSLNISDDKNFLCIFMSFNKLLRSVRSPKKLFLAGVTAFLIELKCCMTLSSL